MSRTCSVCSHPSRELIDRAIAAGRPFRGVARAFGLGRDAVRRHTAHIPRAIAQAHEAAERVRADDLLDELFDLHGEVREIIEAARTSADHGIALRAIGRAAQLIELQARLLGVLVGGGGPVVVTASTPLATMTAEARMREIDKLAAVALERMRASQGDGAGNGAPGVGAT